MREKYVLSAEDLQQIAKTAGQAGAAEYRRASARESKRESKLEITKERLKSYRRAKLALADDLPDPLEIQEVYQKALSDLMDVRELEAGKAVKIIQADAELRQKNAHDIRMLERAVELYGKECEQSKKEEAKRRFKVLTLMHMGKDEMTVEEIAEQLKTGERNIYRDLNAAYAAVSEYYLGI